VLNASTRPHPSGIGRGLRGLAIEHVGYVQIYTINVIERCDLHILWNRISAIGATVSGGAMVGMGELERRVPNVAMKPRRTDA
jgi:hypothetical protein